jgi:hypothetical protein
MMIAARAIGSPASSARRQSRQLRRRHAYGIGEASTTGTRIGWCTGTGNAPEMNSGGSHAPRTQREVARAFEALRATAPMRARIPTATVEEVRSLQLESTDATD